jgi:hypothetical protein
MTDRPRDLGKAFEDRLLWPHLYTRIIQQNN